MFNTKPAIVKAAMRPATQTRSRISRRSSAESISSLEKYGCTRPTPVANRPTKVTAASRLEYGNRKRRGRAYCLNQIRVGVTSSVPQMSDVGMCNPNIGHFIRQTVAGFGYFSCFDLTTTKFSWYTSVRKAVDSLLAEQFVHAKNQLRL